VGDAAAADGFERQQAEHAAKGGDLTGAGQARRGDRAGQVEGDQARHQQQHAGVVAGDAQRLGWPGATAGAGWVVAAGAATLVGGSGSQPLEPLVAQQLPDPGAVQRRGGGGQGLGDLGDCMAGLAQPQDLVAGCLLGGATRGPGRRSMKKPRSPARKSRTIACTLASA
jgi:hypothetical protein